MANVVVVGAQWGDEGKGKIVDWLSEQADIVVRFQGGHNAGHTLVINGETYKLALLPSGVLRPSKLAVIGNGVVFDPQAFLDEVAKLKGQGVAISPENLRVAENVTLILPLHRELDALRETADAATAIGTTRRGIGPAYEDKVGRRAIRLMDLADHQTLPHKINRLLAHHNALRRGLGLPEFDGAVILKELMAMAPQLLPYADTVWRLLDIKRREGKRILFEGAQGALLDVDHGTYPYVTSSNTVLTASRSAPAIFWTARRSTICRPARGRRPGSSRFTRPSRVGRSRPPTPGPGRICRPRPSNMSAGWRNWWAVQSPCFPPAPNAKILSWSRTRLRLNGMLPQSLH